MSGEVSCPSCGAPAAFAWSGSVEAVCRYCRTVLLRTDVKVEQLGKRSDLPPDPSPVCLGTRGVYHGNPFTAVGRIVYEYEGGRWNEWSLVFADGTTGWLSDAQLQYAVTHQVTTMSAPARATTAVGSAFLINGKRFTVVSITEARYLGVEGELPFRTWGREVSVFADLRTAERHFATFDWSEAPGLVFAGDPVAFKDLKLSGLRSFDGWKEP